MALTDTARAYAGAESLSRRLSNVFRAATARVIAWNDARVTRTSLAKLSDRELEDIGLSRGDIDAIVRKVAG